MAPPPAPADASRTGSVLSRTSVGRLTGRFARSLGASAWVQTTGRFLRRHLWAWPVAAAAVLGGVGWWVDRSVEAAMRRQREATLTTILNADVKALRVWMAEQGRNAAFIADDDRLRPAVNELLARPVGGPDNARALLLAKAQADLRARLAPAMKECEYSNFFLVDPDGFVVASDQDMAVGLPLTGYRKEFFAKVLADGPSVSKPYPSALLLKNAAGDLRANLPTMLAAAPIKDAAGKPVACFGFRMRPDDEFTRILQAAQAGETGETFAVDASGLLLSNSRFDDELKRIGLLPDLPEFQSVLTLTARDPGADLTAGERPAVRRQDLPLTRDVAAVVAGETGCDPDGYRDYRGVPTVGAWAWLPEYDFGVVTEMDRREAFAPVVVLRRAFWGLMALLGLAAAGMFAAMLFIARQQKALQRAALEARQLGQYTLLDKLGAGGMGTVYRARHAMLRRPTAVKLLDLETISEAAVARFEREVQLTAGLTHPNTVAVYDYGRTPEGIFYYAMEFLDGSNLDDLVARAGPLPEARAVFVLRQACGALAEAHATGLVHRDVKPANIFLTRRGGLHDFVKVLDFGLVKAVGGGEEGNVTSAGAVTGTPLYMAPEAVDRPDEVGPRADVYALGAVGYFLLTGTPVFAGASVVEICLKHVREAPEPPSARAGRPLSPGLEALLLRCLAKAPAERPADAAALLAELDAVTVVGRWTEADAAAWWAAPPAKPAPGPVTASGSAPSAVELTTAYG